MDFGCCNGAFHLAAPPTFNCTGWDVNPDSPFTGQVPHGHFDVLTLWDVMEHLTAPLEPIVRYTPDTVFICTPDADNACKTAFWQWKHYKPIEHLYYFTPHTLTLSMASVGYNAVHTNHSEGRLRDADNPNAIFTAVFVKCPSQNSSI